MMGEKTIVDLFCGCGGLSLGSSIAGFKTILSVDVDPILQSGYRRNFPTTKVVEADLANLEASDWKQLLGNARPDGVIGGPPCQGFSRIGKRRSDDPRNSLIYHFFRHISDLKPKFFIMENVEGLLDERNSEFLAAGLTKLPSRYRVIGPVVLNAADLGAATVRRRVVLLGYDPSEMNHVELETLVKTKQTKPITVREAICDLPSPRLPRDDADFDWSEYPLISSKNVSDYAKAMRSVPPTHLGWSIALERLAHGFISGVVKTRHSREISRRYSGLASGKSDPITKSYKLDWDGQCPTLRAGTGPDRGSFQAVRPIHPSKGRVITVREAARLQGFPDWFVFHPTKWHSFRMIGNSVSPIVAQAILGAVQKSLA